MSAADAALIRELLEAFNRGDYDASTAMFHDDIELHQASEIPDTGTYFGKEEVVRGIVRWLSGFERGFQYVPEEVTDAGDCVLVRVRLHGRGRGSGVELDEEIFHVWEVRDGKAFRVQVFWREDEALEAAGITG